jgi:hypothetical protein
MVRIATCLAAVALLLATAAPNARADLSDKLGSLTGTNAKGFLSPLPKAMSSSLNAGIFTNGRIPKSGVALTLGLRVMGVGFGDADKTYVPTDPAGFTSNSPTPVPTIIGAENGATVQGQGGTQLIYPGGFNIDQFALAAPEITVESVMGTRLVGRWFAAKLGDSDYGKLELIGIGGQHSISQYFPALPADVAAGVFYQTLKLGDGILDTKALHVDVTASRRFGKGVTIEPYVSVGYDTFKMDVSYKDSTDPSNNISLSMDNESNAHLAAGAQLSLVFAKLHAEVFSAANTGASIGLSFGH